MGGLVAVRLDDVGEAHAKRARSLVHRWRRERLRRYGVLEVPRDLPKLLLEEGARVIDELRGPVLAVMDAVALSHRGRGRYTWAPDDAVRAEA